MQNALADVPAHDFDNLVVTRRKSKTINELRDEGGGGERSSRNRRGGDDNRSKSETPQQSLPQQPSQPQSHEEPQHQSEANVTYNEPEPVQSGSQGEREPEPTYTEPEPPYREPEPVYNEPTSSPASGGDYSDVPTPGGGAVKGR